MSKYNQSKVVFQGIKFDSKQECSYYQYLLKLKESGEIVDIQLQPKKTLIPNFKKYGITIRGCTYSPDFLVTYKDGHQEYIDVKGMSTDASKLRRKLWDFLFPNDILRWIAASVKYGVDGWIDYDELQRIRRNNKKNKGG